MMLTAFLQDVRYGVRTLAKQPGFTLAAVLTLALGIGANTAIFSVVNAVLLRPLPFDDPEQIMQVWATNTEEGDNDLVVSVPDFLDWQHQNRSFEQLAAYSSTSFILNGAGEPERVRGAKVSASFFPLLRVQPVAGRILTPEDDRVGGERVALVGHGLWQRRFAGDPRLIGQTVRLNDESYRVIGIMPPGFNFPVRKVGGADIWVPHAFDPNASMSKRSSSYLGVLGRLKRGVTREQVQADMESITRVLAEQFPATNRTRGAYVVPLREQLVEKARPMLLILLGAVSFVLLIACINVANLLLARASARHKEMSIRSALGATRARLIRQFLTESVLLGLLGGVAGLLLAAWGLRLLVALAPPEITHISEISLDRNVLAWTFALSVLTGLLFGLAPAIKSSRLGVAESLKENAHGATAGRERGRLRSLLIVGEVALSLVLLVGAGLLLKSLWRLQNVEAGFTTDNVLTMTLSLPQYRFPDVERQRAFHARVVERLQNIPGVGAAGMTTILPLSGISEASDFQVVGRQLGKGWPSLNTRAVSPDYLRAIGIQLLKGRSLTERDDRNAPPVCLVNGWMARRVFEGEDPIGRRIKTGGVEWEIVGVVGDVKHRALSGEPDFEMYVPYTQYPFVSNMTYVLRTGLDPAAVVASARAAIGAVDPEQVVDNVQTMDQVLLKSIAQPRFNTFLLSLFAAVALLIASVGLYGTLSYMVAQRTHEIGVRVALGARVDDVVRLVVGQGMKLVLAGVAAGAVGAFVASRVLSGFLFEVSPTDVWTFAAAPLLLMLVALVACYAPARHAAKVDPLVALRYE
ncbi:MAG: ABC transporter permease [Pyrinomonadaceae bacterium]